MNFVGNAYTRRFTADEKLTQEEIEKFEESKQEILREAELATVKGAGLEQLNIDTLNQYIIRYNTGKRNGEKLKTGLEDAMAFLDRQFFIRNKQPTLLGMLVCGDDLDSYVQGRCELDAYVLSPTKVAQSKEIITDNLVSLIERAFNFVWRNIQVGIIYAKGGSAAPEYPEELIRECINNAIAHRNYLSERFSIVEIKPQESLIIRNPGTFQRRQRIHLEGEFGKIRRIIPIQVARNPKLAHLLKSFDYWEGKGRGLSSLTNACLDNLIDVPYYVLAEDEIKLCIPKGKVFDDEQELWLSGFAGYIYKKMGRELSEDEKIMLSFFRKSELLNRYDHYTVLLTTDNNHKEVIATLYEKGLIFIDPQSPELYPIYLVDRVLTKLDFTEELRALFGPDWELLNVDSQEILSAVFLHNKYGLPNDIVSANSIGTYLFLKKHKRISDIKLYENYKRKVRTLINKLEFQKMIIRKGGNKPDFALNTAYKTSPSFFNP